MCRATVLKHIFYLDPEDIKYLQAELFPLLTVLNRCQVKGSVC